MTQESNLTQTGGGKELRRLREAADLTQLVVELEAGLGSGYLQRVEAGKVGQPERETLERILAALNAPYVQRRHLLELFGYNLKTPLPTEAETKWAVNLSRPALDEVALPAYLLDCTHRLRAFNRLFAAVMGGARLAENLMGESLLRAWFDPATGLAGRLENPDTFYPAMLRAFQYEMSLLGKTDWYEEVLEDLLRLPLFKTYWEQARPNEAGYAVAARPLQPLGLHVPRVGLLRFRLSSEALWADPRFRLIYYLPADAATIEQCAAWV